MKKIIVLLCTVLTFSAFTNNVKAGAYEDGFQNGFSFGYDMVSYLVAMHPEYGMQGGQTPGMQEMSSYYGPGIGTNTPVDPAMMGNPFYNMSGGYSAYWAGQVVLNHLWAVGSFSWLANQAANGGAYEQGLYDGFVSGTYQWIMNHPM